LSDIQRRIDNAIRKEHRWTEEQKLRQSIRMKKLRSGRPPKPYLPKPEIPKQNIPKPQPPKPKPEPKSDLKQSSIFKGTMPSRKGEGHGARGERIVFNNRLKHWVSSSSFDGIKVRGSGFVVTKDRLPVVVLYTKSHLVEGMVHRDDMDDWYERQNVLSYDVGIRRKRRDVSPIFFVRRRGDSTIIRLSESEMQHWLFDQSASPSGFDEIKSAGLIDKKEVEA
jgi:hypothetical protein